MVNKVNHKDSITDLENNIGSIIDFDLTTELDSINNCYCRRPFVEEEEITHTLDIDPDLNLLCHQDDNV